MKIKNMKLNLRLVVAAAVIAVSITVYMSLKGVQEKYENWCPRQGAVCSPKCCMNGNASELSCSGGCICKQEMQQGTRGGNNSMGGEY